MRYWWGAVAVLALCSLVSGVAPVRAEAGEPVTALTDDGFGVLVGSPEAPVQLEIFCEPQCPHCAQFEAASGDQIGRELDAGRLAVTYRWLTFLDDRRDNDASAQMSTALMSAADPATPARAYQDFVTDLYDHQDPHADPPTATGLATMAAHNGVAPMAIARIAAGLPSVDTAAMNTANRERLNQVNPDNPGTPTVYNRGTDTVVETQDAGWLDGLLGAG
jgi:protein-disulfide isomerase